MSEENNENQSQASDGTVEADQQPQAEAIERPDYIPEKFWDAEAGQPKVKELANSYQHVEKKMSTARDELRSEIEEELKESRQQNVPESYELKIPDDMVPEGVDLNLDSDNPEVRQAMEFAKKNNLTQEQFDDLVKIRVGTELQGYERSQQELAKLGERAQQRIDRLVSWGQSNLNSKDFETFRGLAHSAEQVKLLESIVSLNTGKAFHVDEGGSEAEPLTREKLKEMRRDPRYMSDKDYREKVDRGYQLLFPGNTRMKQGRR